MAHTSPPPGRRAARWFVWLGLIHFIPVIWFLLVAGGLAPTVLLLAFGLASLFHSDPQSWPMALLTLGPGLIYAALLWGAAWLLTWLLWKIPRPLLRSLSLLLFSGGLLLLASQPVYVSGGHSASYQHNLLQLVESFGKQLPPWLLPTYICAFSGLLLGLLILQHRPGLLPDWSLPRRRKWQIGLALAILVFLGLVYTHRVLLFVRPLAELGLPSAQYHLAMSLSEHPSAALGSTVSRPGWLQRAAAQGHPEAALELSRTARTREERLRWLRQAAKGENGEAQFRLFELLAKAKASPAERTEAADWLRKAAASGDPRARFQLGRFALDGRNPYQVAKDLPLARQLLEQAAAADSGAAMQELAWRYRQAANGFPLDLARAAELYQQLAEGYQDGRYGLKKNLQQAAETRRRAGELAELQQRLETGDPAALRQFGLEQLQAADAPAENRQQGLELLRRAAKMEDAESQYQLGFILLNGRHGIAADLPAGRRWWEQAAAQNHVKAMEYLAKAYQSGQFGYPVDLYRANQLTQKLISAYRDGEYGVDPDAKKLRRWQDEEKYFQRISKLAGGYLSPQELRSQAEAGDLQAQYQLAKQQLLAGHQPTRQEGLGWLEKAAEGGWPEAQYRMVTYYQTRDDIIRNNPQRGVRLLNSAADAGHLPALSTLALAHEKGRYNLPIDRQKARDLYQRLLNIYATGTYLGEVDERFINFQRGRLQMLDKLLQSRNEQKSAS